MGTIEMSWTDKFVIEGNSGLCSLLAVTGSRKYSGE